MAIVTTYKTGTASVAAGGTTVTGTGTNFAGLRSGDIFAAQGLTISIERVNSATSLTLSRPWPGAAMSAEAYEVRFTPDASRVLATSRQALEEIELLRDNLYAESHVYNNITEGLAAKKNGEQFLVIDSGVVIRYRRDSATAATERVRYPTPAALTNAITALNTANTNNTAAINAAIAALNSAAADAAALVAAQVKADADRAVAARRAFLPVHQVGAALPARPDAEIVHWFTWGDPSATGSGAMDALDTWFQQPQPAAALQIDSSLWNIHNAMDGSRALLQLFSTPRKQNPPILGMEYRLGDDQPAIAFPMTPGETFIEGLTNGQVYPVQVRARNYLGGEWSSIKAVSISSLPFSDNFNRTVGQKLSAAGSWKDVVSSSNHGLVIDSGGIAVTGGNSRNELALVRAWMPDDHFAEAIITGTEAVDWRNSRGAHLLVRAENVEKGYSLLFSPTGWSVRKIPFGGSGAAITGFSGSLGATTYPLKARLEARGSTLSVYINDVLAGTATDTAHPKGNPGLFAYRTTGSWGFDDFKAGPLT